MTALILVIAVPAVLTAGMIGTGNENYYVMSLLVIAGAAGALAAAFEGRKPQAREIVVIAVLTAIAVAGRAAFFMLPQIKPMAAVVIVSGVCLGGEAGFIVGALAAFVSNFIFGQGPMTPFQMFGMGMIGFLAGILFGAGRMGPKKIFLYVYGGLAAFFLYGGIVNLGGIFLRGDFTWESALVWWGASVPFDLAHAASTVVFLLILAGPMMEKINRVKLKFGLMEPGGMEKCG